MPTISSFLGIVIRMYYREHGPPHFHAVYQDHEVRIAIASFEILSGSLPRRALALVLEWAKLHQQQLQADWARAEAHRPLHDIAPLE